MRSIFFLNIYNAKLPAKSQWPAAESEYIAEQYFFAPQVSGLYFSGFDVELQSRYRTELFL